MDTSRSYSYTFQNKVFKYYNDWNTARGDHYYQLWHDYPVLKNFYFQYELDYDPEPLLNMMKANAYFLPLVASLFYLLLCWQGQEIMKSYKAFDLKWALGFWNLFLSAFSFYGVTRTVPHLFYRIATESFEDTVCTSAHVAYGGGVCGLATQLFILSKIPELVDTVFIVLRKKPLIFLHWYHHLTVLLYCWNSYVTESSAGLYFVAMNYSVHAIMYFYFFLMAINMVPKWFNPAVITFFQIAQMIVGTGIVCACLYFYKYGTKVYTYQFKFASSKCGNTDSNLIFGGIIYASYLYLFVEFAVKRFIFGDKNAGNIKGKAESTKSSKKEL